MREIEEELSSLTTRQIRNLIKIEDRATIRARLLAELVRRDRERYALRLHILRGRERAKEEGRLRHS